jgi:hypothetical protein
VEGSLVRWQKWQFRVGFNSREGLVLHNVAYSDAGVVRPVLHRASLVEMAVPYGDPRCARLPGRAAAPPRRSRRCARMRTTPPLLPLPLHLQLPLHPQVCV